jgi:CRP-like cAMP-binding protein
MNLSDQPDGLCELECNQRLLREQPIFAELTPELLRVVAYFCERETFAPGQTILAEGEPAEAAVIVVRGEVRIERDGRGLAVVPAGKCVGGMALLGRFRWIYDLRAETEVECLLLPRRKLLPQLLAQPVALASVARELVAGVVMWDLQRLERAGETRAAGPGMI